MTTDAATLPSADYAGLPSPCILQVFCLAECAKDALAWKLTCRRFAEICGAVALLRVAVLGEASAAVNTLDASSRDMSTWHGLDLDFAPMQLVQQVGRYARPGGGGSCAAQPTVCRHWCRHSACSAQFPSAA